MKKVRNEPTRHLTVTVHKSDLEFLEQFHKLNNFESKSAALRHIIDSYWDKNGYDQ